MSNDSRGDSRMEFLAPAKINLFLHVVGKRADGNHEINTQFQFLEFADTIGIELNESARVRRVDEHAFELPKKDLCIRAVELLQSTFPETAKHGVTITLKKVIPPGSGLGGGSSNAAVILLALNHLWKLGMSRQSLAELGLQLGADVPVFVHGHAALASGVGEELVAHEAAEQWLCVCLPPVTVSTALVFAHPLLKPMPARAEQSGNDLEPITTQLFPEVGTALEYLRKYGEASMSGSGGAVYVAFSSRGQAEYAFAALPGTLTKFVTRSRNRHPLWNFPGD